MPDYIQCPHCKGKGKNKLSGVYAQTLAGVRRMCARKGGFVVANIHACWFGCSPTALNNRLARLEELGFVKSEKYGRQRRFTLT